MDYTTILFDVNETLSDLRPLGRRFLDVGAPESLPALWFSHVLRDGFALTATGQKAAFADIGADVLRGLFGSVPLDRDTEAAVRHVMEGFMELDVHEDVREGVRGLTTAGYRLATLSNGAANVATTLLDNSQIRDEFDLLLSVEAAPAWKPGAAAYEYAVRACRSTPAQVLLVAVHPWDIHGAARAGLATAWINRTGASYPGHFRAPDHVVTDLRDLPAELGHDA